MFRCSSCGALNNVRAGVAGTAVCGRCKTPLDSTGAPQEVDEAALGRTVDSATVPVLVDFWAPWCGPCRAAAPVVEQVAREHAGSLVALKVNTDENPAAAGRHGIQGIPTFILFRDGQPVARQSGAMSKAAFDAWLRQAGGQGPNR